MKHLPICACEFTSIEEARIHTKVAQKRDSFVPVQKMRTEIQKKVL